MNFAIWRCTKCDWMKMHDIVLEEKEKKTPLLEVICCLVERETEWKNLMWKLTVSHICYAGDVPCTQITVELTSVLKCWEWRTTTITINKLEVRLVISLIILLIQIWKEKKKGGLHFKSEHLLLCIFVTWETSHVLKSLLNWLAR